MFFLEAEHSLASWLIPLSGGFWFEVSGSNQGLLDLNDPVRLQAQPR